MAKQVKLTNEQVKELKTLCAAASTTRSSSPSKRPEALSPANGDWQGVSMVIDRGCQSPLTHNNHRHPQKEKISFEDGDPSETVSWALKNAAGTVIASGTGLTYVEL